MIDRYVRWREEDDDDPDLDLEEEHIPPDKVIAWRKRVRKLATRPILESEWPRLIEHMKDDGLTFTMNDGGYQWFHGRYPVPNTAIRRAWRLSKHQWRRLTDYIYRHPSYWDNGGHR